MTDATPRKLKYPVNDFIDPHQLRTDLEIDQLDLSMSMMKQAGHFAYYSTMAAQAQHQCDRMEQMQDIVEARLDKKIRDRNIAEGTKTTEAQIKAQVNLEPDMIAIKTAVNKARMVATLCKSAADSFRHRRDMLIQMSFNSREERKGELRTFENEAMDRHRSFQQAQSSVRNTA